MTAESTQETGFGFFNCSECGNRVEAENDSGGRVCVTCQPVVQERAEAELLAAQEKLGIAPVEASQEIEETPEAAEISETPEAALNA